MARSQQSVIEGSGGYKLVLAKGLRRGIRAKDLGQHDAGDAGLSSRSHSSRMLDATTAMGGTALFL